MTLRCCLLRSVAMIGPRSSAVGAPQRTGGTPFTGASIAIGWAEALPLNKESRLDSDFRTIFNPCAHAHRQHSSTTVSQPAPRSFGPRKNNQNNLEVVFWQSPIVNLICDARANA